MADFKLKKDSTVTITTAENGIKVTTGHPHTGRFEGEYVFNDIDAAMSVIGKQLKEKINDDRN